MIARHSLEILELRIAPAGVVVDAIDVAVDHNSEISSATVLGPDFAANDLVVTPLEGPSFDTGSFSLFDLDINAPVTNALVVNIASIISAGVVSQTFSGFSSALGLSSLSGASLSNDLVTINAGPAENLDLNVGSVIVVESSGLTGASPEALLIVNL